MFILKNNKREKMNKNKLVIILLFLFTGLGIHAQDFEEITMDLSEPNKKGILKVKMNKGPITVKGTDRKDILIKYTSLESHRKSKFKNHDDDSSETKGMVKIVAASMDLEISENDNTIKVISDDWNKGLVLEIEVPKEMDLKLKTYNEGGITVKDVSGALELTSYNGPIAATNISGSVIADTYNGKILATFDKVTPNEHMAFTNYNGGLDLTFPSDIAATFKISNKQGDVYTGFDMTMVKQPNTNVKGQRKIVIGKWVVGQVNGGGAEITLENYNGNIYIREKE